ncbi:hypothetical protein ACFLYB_04700 [Chloroflexota bacterium]
MTQEPRAYPLIETAIRRSPLSRLWTITAIAGVLLLLLVLMASLDGKLSSLLDWSVVRPTFSNIIFATYILVVYPFMLRSREKAVLAFKPLLSLDDDAFNKVAENISKPNRRGEWTAIILGISVLGVVFFQPWTLDWASGYLWMTVYEVITTTIGMSLMGWLIYDASVGIVRVSRLSRQGLKLDILNTEKLAPVAVWSLGMSFVFVGILTLAIIMDVSQTAEIVLDFKYFLGYGFLVGTALLIFFFSMWSVHGAMSEARKSKLTLARKHLAEISRELEDREVKRQREGMIELSSTFTAWTTYKREVQEAPTWPFNAMIIRRLFASILTPGLVYLIKILSQTGIRFGS